jgi:hypothetical protein
MRSCQPNNSRHLFYSAEAILLEVFDCQHWFTRQWTAYSVIRERNADLVASDDSVKFRSDLLNKKSTTLFASFELRSAQTLFLEARNDPAAGALDGTKLVFTCLIKGTDAVITKKINATEAEITTQRLAVEDIASVGSCN